MKNFELQIPETNLTDASILIRWKLSPKLTEKLSQKNEKQYVVLCAISKNKLGEKFEVRKIVPLKEGATYLNFRFPGDHEIVAFIADKYIARQYIKPFRHIRHREYYWLKYIYFYFLHDKEYEFLNKNFPYDIVNVNVPHECFSKPPPEFESKWVNWLYRDLPIDQCDYRRRRLLAYSVQPFLFLLAIWLRIIITAILLLIGGTKLPYKSIFKPISVDLESLPCVIGNSIKFPLLQDGFTYKVFLTPVAIILSFVIFHSLNVIAPILFLISCMFISFSIVQFKNIKHHLDKPKKPKSIVKEKSQKINKDYKYLTYNDDKGFNGIDDLQKKTIRLKYENIKAKICKPYSG